MTNQESFEQSPDSPEMQAWGEQVPMSCPECGGPLRQRQDGTLLRYRCHAGHMFGAKSLLADQGEKVERALWTAVRALEERARMLLILAREDRQRGRELAARSYTDRAAELHEQVQSLRSLLARYREPAK